MSKKSKVAQIFEAPSLEEIAAIDQRLDVVRRAARKPKPRKVDPVMPTIVRCLETGKSSRRISEIVNSAHSVAISKDSILRFARARRTLICL